MNQNHFIWYYYLTNEQIYVLNGICQLASFEHSKLGKLSIGSNIGIIHKLSRLTDLQKNSSKVLNIWSSFLDVLLDVLSCEEYQINKINIFYNISKGASCKVIYNSLSVLEKNQPKTYNFQRSSKCTCKEFLALSENKKEKTT